MWPDPETLDWMAQQRMRSYEMTEVVALGLDECLTEAFQAPAPPADIRPVLIAFLGAGAPTGGDRPSVAGAQRRQPRKLLGDRLRDRRGSATVITNVRERTRGQTKLGGSRVTSPETGSLTTPVRRR
jgi:hypothetical protein